MTKDEWIWVAIRIFGIYLLVLAVIAIPEAIGNVYAYIKMSFTIQDSSDLPKLAISLKEAAIAKGSTAVAQFILFSMVSYYFLRHGKIIHKMASSETA